MSRKEQIAVTCTQCSHEQKATLWRSVNVTLDPEAKKEVLGGKLNFFQCSKCNYQSSLDADLVYHDMEKEFIVMYYPLTSLGEVDLTSEFDRHGRFAFDLGENPAGETAYDYGKDIHVVFDMNELARYVFFREKLFKAYGSKR